MCLAMSMSFTWTMQHSCQEYHPIVEPQIETLRLTKKLAPMKKGRRTVEKDTAKPRVKFSPDIPELPLNNLSDLEDDDSSIDLTYDDFAYGGSKSSRAARHRPPAVGRDPGNYGPLSAREMGMSREFPGKIVKVHAKFPKPFNAEKKYSKWRADDIKNRVHPYFMSSMQEYDDPWERELKRLRHQRQRYIGDRPFQVTPHHRTVLMRERRQAQSNCTSHGPYVAHQVVSMTGKWEPYKNKHKWTSNKAWRATLKLQRKAGM